MLDVNDKLKLERFIDFNDEHPENVLLISSIFFGPDTGKAIDSNATQFSNIPQILITFVRSVFERTKDFNDEHSENI